MKLYIFLASLIISLVAFADQPPDWRDYVVTSKNRKWTALVSRNYAEKDPWDDAWTLSIYKGFHYPYPRPDLKPVWSMAYGHSGYSEGQLSDDGKIFVYVEFWYREHYPAIKIYREDCVLVKNGSFFNVGKNLEKTVSHELWLKEGGETKFVVVSSKPYIRVPTVAGDRHVQAYYEQQT